MFDLLANRPQHVSNVRASCPPTPVTVKARLTLAFRIVRPWEVFITERHTYGVLVTPVFKLQVLNKMVLSNCNKTAEPLRLVIRVLQVLVLPTFKYVLRMMDVLSIDNRVGYGAASVFHAGLTCTIDS